MKRTPLILILLILMVLSGACSAGRRSAALPTLAATADVPVFIVHPTGASTGAAQPLLQSVAAAPPGTPTPGPIWVANPVDQTVLRIDTVSNTVETVIPMDGQPETVAVGENAVWVLDRKNDDIIRIDPVQNTVTGAIAITQGDANSLTTGAGSVWVGVTGRVDFESQTPEDNLPQVDEFLPPGFVVQIDPRKNEQTGEYSIQPVSRLVLNGSALWILSHGVIDTPVQVIDLANRQGMAVPFHNAPEWMLVDAIAVNPAHLWLFSSAYGKIFHATPDGRILAAIDLQLRQPTGYADLLWYGDELWAAAPWGTVLRIDPNTNQILAQVELDVPLTGLISGNNAIWALSQQTAALYRLDPTRAEVTARIETGSRVQPTVIPCPTPRVVVWQPCPDAPNSRLKVGDLAYVTKDPPIPNRVREAPDRAAKVLGHITPAGGMDIIDGPQCANGWVWWKVKNADLEGWTAEGDKETYWLVPLFP